MEMLLVIAVIVVVLVIIVNVAKASTIAAARKAYLDALADLKQDPANSNKRQNTLALGRNYSNLARNSKGQTVFDEVALMNDINAVCAATSQVLSVQPIQKGNVEARLSNLLALRDKGLITSEEYTAKKSEILADI